MSAYTELAKKLVASESERERKLLLSDWREKPALKLALALKEICYNAWTIEPIKAQKAAAALKTLSKLNQNAETEALCFWVSGIAELTKGKLDKAVKNLDESAATFEKIDKEHEAAQTQVAKLYALALLGRYDAAIECGKNALKIFTKNRDEIAAGKIENNIGNIYIRQELLKEAEKYYLAARNRFAKIGDAEQLLLSEINLANTYSALNDFRRAERFYKKTLLTAQKNKMAVREAEIETNIGNLALFRGKFDEALKFLELSRRKYEELKMPHQTAIAELEIADVYLELNLAQEAFSIYRQTADTLHKLKLQGEEARARANFGRVAVLLGDAKTAATQLKKSARLYIAEKNAVGAAIVKISEASHQLNRQNYKGALKLAGEAETLLETSENVRHKLTAFWLKGEALRNLGENAAARKILEKTFADAARQEQKNIAQAALNSLGEAALDAGDIFTAKKYFKRAIEIVEKLRAPLAAEEFRMAYFAGKLSPFENLARIYLAENQLRKALLYVEKARARSLVDALDGNVEPTRRQNVSPKLNTKLANLREELNWFYSRLSRADQREVENLQREAKLREKQIAATMRQIESASDAKFDAQKSLNFKQLQSQLGAEKSLIEFVSFDGILSAFVVSGKKIRFVTNLATESEIFSLLENLRFQFGALRYGAENLQNFLPELKRRADFYLRKLYEKLFQPLESFVEQSDLIVVPVGAAHYVPFHALFDGESYLIETREIVISPGATVWQKLATKPTGNLQNALLIGFADEAIPLVDAEIASLVKLFPEAKSFTGKKATFAAYTENAPHFDILHLACHGQFRPENPLFSSLHLADGFVTARDVCSQNLKAGLVTLSACETGLNEVFAGEEILGLARGFLSAGASSLILSLWTVSDAATTRLMRDFYKNLQRGANLAASLKAAQNNFIKKDVHPYFWAPFVLIGK